MKEQPDFEWVLDGLGDNRDSAAEAVVRATFDKIVGVVRKRISSRYQAKVDAESIANSTLKSFFRRHDEEPFDLGEWRDLWNLLIEIALNKLRGRIRAFRTARRDVDKERQADGADQGRPAGADTEAVANDLYDFLADGCAAEEVQVLDLSLQGYTTDEIGGQVGVSPRTVIRIRNRFKARLESALRDGA